MYMIIQFTELYVNTKIMPTNAEIVKMNRMAVKKKFIHTKMMNFVDYVHEYNNLVKIVLRSSHNLKSTRRE